MTETAHSNPPSTPGAPHPGRWPLALGMVLKAWRWVENIAFVAVLLLIGLYFVLQSSWVQNWLIRRTTDYLSKELETTVSIGHIDISFFDQLALEQVYIQDQHGDTLLYAGQLAVGLKDNVFSVLDRELNFDAVSLSNAHVYLRRPEGSYAFNYQFLVDYFSGNKTPNPDKKTRFLLKARNVRLNNVTFIQYSEVSGQKMTLAVPKAVIQVKKIDFAAKKAELSTVELTGLYFSLDRYAAHPMPPQPGTVRKDTAAAKVSAPFEVMVERFHLHGGRFDMNRFDRTAGRETPANTTDFNHLAVQNIALEAEELYWNTDMHFAGILRHFAAREPSGLAITHASARHFVANDTTTALYGCSLELPHTRLGDTIALHYDGYGALNRFTQAVALDVRLKEGSFLQLSDLAPLKASLAGQPLFADNEAFRMALAGQINGKINRLDGRNMVVKVGESTYLDFDFDGEDLTKGNDLLRMEFDFRRAQTNMAALHRLIPGFKPPASFSKLGNIRFSGTYNLLFGYNHILAGDIHSDIGDGKLDMKLDLTEGRKNALYSGKLYMHNFDLKSWTGNKDFGHVSFNVSIGAGARGLTLSTMNAKIIGSIDSLDFKGYSYKSMNINGLVRESLFEGQAGISDPNIRFNFDGKINFQDTIPAYLFSARLEHLDLKRLHWSDDDIVVSANVEEVRLIGKGVSDLAGTANIGPIRIRQRISGDSVLTHTIDSIRFESSYSAEDQRHFSLRSELLTVDVNGQYNLAKAPRNFMRLLARYYPQLAAQLKLPVGDTTEITDVYRFGVFINSTEGLTRLIDKQLDTIKNVSLGGQVNAEYGISEMYATIPRIKYGATIINRTGFNWRSEQGRAVLMFEAPETLFSNKKRLPPIRLVGKLNNDELKFDLFSRDTSNIVRSVNLSGILSVADSLWQIRFKASQFDLFNLEWNIAPDNYIRFGKNYIEANNFALMNGLHRIILDSENEGKGLRLTCSNFDLSFINELIPRHGLQYRGNISDFDIVIEDVFKMKNARLFLSTDTLFVNHQPYGRIDGNVELHSLNDPLEWSISTRDRHFHFTTSGAWLLSGQTERTSEYAPKTLQPGDFYSKLEADSFPMSIVQQFVPGISNTAGRFNFDAVLDGSIKGKNTRVGLDGKALIHEGGFKLDYLNVPFYIKKQRLLFTDNKIWADGVPHANGIAYDTIYDATHKNMALVRGGLKHEFFRKWKIDCEVQSVSNNFLLMDTKKVNNPVYYGKGIGSFRAIFGGTFSKTDMEIYATTGANTRLFIPLTSETEAKATNFINFTTPAPATPSPQLPPFRKLNPSDMKGLNVKMTLTMTEQAEVQLIFDEKAGDILKGKGTGTISIELNRNGDFLMNGNYSISEGEYLFTLLNLSISLLK